MYTAPDCELIKIQDKDIITGSPNFNGNEIDAGGSMGGGVDLPDIGGGLI